MGTVREERESRYLSQEDLASKAEMSKTTVIRAESGERIARRSAWRIARVFGMKPEQITDLNYAGKRNVVAHVQPGNS